MGTSGVNALLDGSSLPKGGASSGQPAWDNHETGIRNEIKRLQEEIKNLSRDDKLSSEQRARQKQALQEEIHSLNSELRQYKLQKRQEEVREKQDGAKPDAPEADKKAADKKETAENLRQFGSEKLGVIVTLSLSKDQVASLEKVRKHLEGRHRTADSREEKADLQKKLDNVPTDVWQKIVITEDSLKDPQGGGKFGTGVIYDRGHGPGKDDSRTSAPGNASVSQTGIFGNASFVLS